MHNIKKKMKLIKCVKDLGIQSEVRIQNPKNKEAKVYMM